MFVLEDVSQQELQEFLATGPSAKVRTLCVQGAIPRCERLLQCLFLPVALCLAHWMRTKNMLHALLASKCVCNVPTHGSITVILYYTLRYDTTKP